MTIVLQGDGWTEFYYYGQKIGRIKDFGVKGRHCLCTVFCGNVGGVAAAKVYVNGVLKSTLRVSTPRAQPQKLESKGVLVVGQNQRSLWLE